jgi:outer membrane receptor protein involved in Fe transport
MKMKSHLITSSPHHLIIFTIACIALLSGASATAHATGIHQVRFVVVDGITRLPAADAEVVVDDILGVRPSWTVRPERFIPLSNKVFDVRTWREIHAGLALHPTTITLPLNVSVMLQGQAEPPVKDIYIQVHAQRLQPQKTAPTSGQTVDREKIKARSGADNNINSVIKSDAGVASDSAGQQHVRGEHAEISYVVDGVPLPDTLSGRQGSVVVPSTIESLEVLTGGYAPEFGGQTAAILNITTLPSPARSRTDLNFAAGSFDTTNGGFTSVGPIGKSLSYVVDFGATRTRNAVEPQQPDNDTAHNAGSSLSYFTKLRYIPGKRDTITLSLSSNPDTLQISNRTGLPASFALAGQGFGFLGLRNANGARPDITDENRAALGAQTLLLPSQQAEGQDITQREISEFATLSWRHVLSKRETSVLAYTVLHSGQDLHNHNPGVDLQNLPVDNSIEYNPTAIRNVHHSQLTGSITSKQGAHTLKAGLLLDDENGNESYRLVPASQLALNALAALSPALSPPGSVLTDAQGNPVLDVNGNPVYQPTGPSPTLNVHRSGFYRAAYIQDTWQVSRRFIMNYGVRADWYKQGQNLGQPVVSVKTLSPRLNFSYLVDRASTLRWSYNRLFNTPPLAQGAVLGAPIEPEILDQYEVSYDRQIARGQEVKVAYYVKDIRNQIDTGLLIPGSQIGLYSALNLQYGGVHGIEFSYEITPPKGIGFDAFLNYTYSIARPNGLDNTGEPVPLFNDHDQRNTVALGLGYTWRGGATASVLINHGSGLASSIVPPSDKRTPRTLIDLHFGSGTRLFRGRGSLALDILNVTDDRTVINFQSAFSGTRFQQARRFIFSITAGF